MADTSWVQLFEAKAGENLIMFSLLTKAFHFNKSVINEGSGEPILGPR